MSYQKGEKWKNYINHYPLLRQYDLNDSYPYKELGEALNLHVNAIHQLVRWIREKPEVIAYLRTMYSAQALPPWVGELYGATLERLQGYLGEGGYLATRP